jgi:hypothetical protein
MPAVCRNAQMPFRTLAMVRQRTNALEGRHMSNIIFNDLEIGFAADFRWRWDDRGSGADRDGSFFKAENLPEGFYRLGDLAVDGYPRDNNREDVGRVNDCVLAIVKDRGGGATPALAVPERLEIVYGDWGSGADRDGSFWRIIPPAGYVALGDICTWDYDAPDKNDYRCVRKDLVVSAVIDGTFWDDAGSGANQDVTLWALHPPMAADSEFYFNSGSFLANGVPADQPIDPGRAYALRGAIALQQPTTQRPPAPVLRNRDQPVAMEAALVEYVSILPWYAVRDDAFNAIQKLASSPTYRLVRRDCYKLASFISNDGNTAQASSLSYSEGYDESETKSFSSTTGIEIGAEYSFSAAFKGSIKLSQSFTYSRSTTTGSNFSTVKQVALNCPPNSSAALYTIHSVFSLYREDGTQVANSVSCDAPGSYYFSTFPATSAAAIAAA